VTIGDSPTLVCSITALIFTESFHIDNSYNVIFIWNRQDSGEILRQENNVMPSRKNGFVIYADSLRISSLTVNDSGANFVCTALRNASRITFNYDVFTLIFPSK